MRGPAVGEVGRPSRDRLQELPMRQRKCIPPAPSVGTGIMESAARLMSRFAPITANKRLPETVAHAR